MEDRLARLEAAVESLSQAATALSHRVAALEAERRASPAPTATPAPAIAAPAAAEVSRPGYSIAALAGRSFLALAGAFLLRALSQVGAGESEEATIGGWGALLGMLYAAAWLYLADRAARKHRAVDACAHGAIAIVIAFPLIWEATFRFHRLSPALAGAALVAFGGALLLGAARRDLPVLAWLGGTAAIATAAGLYVSERGPIALLAAGLLLSATALAVAAWKDWPGLRCPVAAIVNVQALIALMVGGRHNWETLDARAVTILVLGIAGIFLAAIAVDTLARRRSAGPFEVLQSLSLLLISYGGARWELRESPAAQIALAASVLVLGMLCLAAARLVFEEREDQGINLACFTLFGALLLGEGVRSLLPAAVGGALLGAMALVGGWLSIAERRWALRVAVAGFAVAAALSSGLVEASWRAFVEPGAPPFGWASAVALAFIAGAYVALRRRGAPALSYTAAALVLLLLASFGAVGEAILAAGLLIAPTDLGALAVARTAVLAVAAVGLAWLAGRRARIELVWATWAVLAFAAIKILADDLRHGRAATMFLTLALYGGALLIAPRLVRKATRN